jgi:hypothetical protein
MPNKDRRGPLGEGPLTGRGLGPCGRGLGRGIGALTKEEEKTILKRQKEDIEKRLQELDNDA